MSFRCISKLLHMHNQYVGHTLDQMLKILILFLAFLAFHLHYLSLAVQLHAGLEARHLLLPSKINVSWKGIYLDVWAKHGVTLCEVYPIYVNRVIFPLFYPSKRNIAFQNLTTKAYVFDIHVVLLDLFQTKSAFMLVVYKSYQIVASLSASLSLWSRILAFEMINTPFHKFDKLIIRCPLWHAEEKLHPKVFKPSKSRIVLPQHYLSMGQLSHASQFRKLSSIFINLHPFNIIILREKLQRDHIPFNFRTHDLADCPACLAILLSKVLKEKAGNLDKDFRVCLKGDHSKTLLEVFRRPKGNRLEWCLYLYVK